MPAKQRTRHPSFEEEDDDEEDDEAPREKKRRAKTETLPSRQCSLGELRTVRIVDDIPPRERATNPSKQMKEK